MNASLDTNVIIHLYKAGLQNILFQRFDNVYVYEFIRSMEMVNHASADIIEQFDKDVVLNNIQLVTNGYLKAIGMYPIFLSHVKDQRSLYQGGDLGEVYAISMAKTIGCICLVTDDIKEYGPHYTLMRTPDSDVIPFAFFELFLLDYLENKCTEDELLKNFESICKSADISWNFESKVRGFLKRFYKDPYTNTEKEWMEMFCERNCIDIKKQFKRLITYMKTSIK